MALKANELRLGNFIACGSVEKYNPTRPDKVESIEGNWVRKTSRIDDPDLLDHVYSWLEGMEIHGIPLTEEWLLKFGFVESEGMLFVYMNKHELDTDKISFKKSEGFICYHVDRMRSLCKHIKYVHQLQNLYFALTGIELEMNKI